MPLARSLVLRSGMGFFLLAGLAGLGAVASYGITRGGDAGGSYTLMTRTESYTLETVVNGTTTTRVVRVRVPVRRVVTEDGGTRTLPGSRETVRFGETVVQVETNKVTVTRRVPVTVTKTETVVVTERTTDTVTTTETVFVTTTEGFPLP